MEQEKKNKKPVKILIVDDLNINVKILENIIVAEGYEALCAMSVQEALDIMKENMPQLILSDFSMPGMDGMEFCKLLKSNPRTRDIPFIFITVADSREDKKAAFLAGAVDFIPKPFEPVEVIMRVNNQLNSYRIKQEMEDYNRMMHQMVNEQKKQMEKEWENVLLAMANLVEKRMDGSADHLERVGHNSHILAQSLQLMPQYEDDITDEFIETIEPASKLCNIGKLVMLGSGAPENKDEQEENRIHAEEGAKILEEIGLGSSRSHFFEMAIVIA
nr:response regulator [Lachnospiraceae bacterium]